MFSFSRRLALKLLGAHAAWLGLGLKGRAKDNAPMPLSEKSSSDWHNTHERVWLGSRYWANPMEDWRIVEGGAECLSSGGDRSIHILTHQLKNPAGALEMSVRVKRIQQGLNSGGVGFGVGIRSDLNEYRSNCFAKGGINCGVIDDELVIGKTKKKVLSLRNIDHFSLLLEGISEEKDFSLTLTVFDADDQEIGRLKETVPKDAVPGNLALLSNFNLNRNGADGSQYRFYDWTVDGDALMVTPSHEFGPLLWSMYSLSNSRSDEGFVLKLSALTGPLGENDNKTIELQVMRDGQWTPLTDATLEEDSWTAVLRVPNWNEKTETPYKLIYRQHHVDGTRSFFERTGTIKAEPTGRPLRIATLTCQNDYAFPYEPVARNLQNLDPDLLYFSGDQLYENHGGFGIIRTPAERAILNYLRKFYQFGWAFGDVMRSRPTLCIPDDHDVFQGNLWGEGGAKMGPGPKDATGGYEEPARMVNVVHRSCVGHHPDFYDPSPCLQGISVYFGEMVYGGVGFAIVGDRQFKSGPGHVETGSGRADHLIDVDIDVASLDKPGLVLLGERQEEFLEHWANDWRGHSMKVLLSQTVFAGVATHHGSYDGYLRADLDSGGWPQTPRNRAVRILRKAKPLHINGDQHLTSLVQYGTDEQRDSCWSFCPPAIAVGYPRWWRPDELGMHYENRPKHALPNTGEYLDSFGNKIYVYAVGNPEVATKPNRYERAHQKGSGFGMVSIDPSAKTYKCESFRFLVDATEDNPENQFPGWPLTIEQKENGGHNEIG